MNVMKKSIFVLSFVTVSILLGCGGGSGSNFEPTDPNTVFNLFPPSYFTSYSSSYNFTGSDTAGGRFTGTFSAQTLSPTTFLGEAAIPILGLLELINTVTNAQVSSTATVYFSDTPNDRRYLGSSSSLTTTVSATTYPIPETALIGDFGLIGTYTDNAGDTTEESWRLDDGGSGTAIFVKLSTTTDQYNDLVTSTTTRDKIATNGSVISESLSVYYADLDVTLTLNSN